AAQTQRAVDNFPISGTRFGRSFIAALGHIKKTAAIVNGGLGLISAERAEYIAKASDEVIAGQFDAHFPIDIFQPGSGTSTNMNAISIPSRRATALAHAFGLDHKEHPPDVVNFG